MQGVAAGGNAVAKSGILADEFVAMMKRSLLFLVLVVFSLPAVARRLA